MADNVSFLHEVTLGGTGKARGDRHPKIRSGVLVGAGAKILGNITIGEGAKIGAGSVVLAPVPAHATVAGVPAKIELNLVDAAPPAVTCGAAGAFLLAIPVFRGGDLYQIAVRLRYRVQGGAVSWSFELHGADRSFDHAFREACEDARARTELPLFYGQPEA